MQNGQVRGSCITYTKTNILYSNSAIWKSPLKPISPENRNSEAVTSDNRTSISVQRQIQNWHINPTSRASCKYPSSVIPLNIRVRLTQARPNNVQMQSRHTYLKCIQNLTCTCLGGVIINYISPGAMTTPCQKCILRMHALETFKYLNCIDPFLGWIVILLDFSITCSFYFYSQTTDLPTLILWVWFMQPTGIDISF